MVTAPVRITDVQVVTFDGDETLWDFQSAAWAALDVAAAVLAELGVAGDDGSPITAQRLAVIRDELAVQPGWRDASMERVRRASFARVSRTDIDDEIVEEVYRRFMEVRHGAVTLYPDTLAGLRSLVEAGLSLALVTNGNSRPDKLGLSEYFACIVTAAECGFRKPDPAFYRYTADRLGVSPRHCVHIGDHPEEDVRAAARAGMRTIWLNRAHAPTPEGGGAWTTVTDLTEVPALLRAAPGRGHLCAGIGSE